MAYIMRAALKPPGSSPRERRKKARSKMAKQINLIAQENADAEKTYRKALGYCWQDYTQRIPGDDRIIPDGVRVPDYVAGLMVEIRAEYGDVIVSHDTIVGATLVVRVTRMWCGGGTEYIYINAKPQSVKDEPMPLDAQETIAAEYRAEAIDLAEQDTKLRRHPGYCTKCHSYCYGDCEANNA